MRVRRTPFSNSVLKPLGAVGKQFPSSSLSLNRKSVSLEFNGGCTVLSINASNSILSEKALQAFKYAFLRNQKIGIGCLPSNESPSQIELDKATAAYEIARNLVSWSEQFCADGDLHDLDINTEEEHRSCDLKKDDLFSRSGPSFVDAKKDFSNSSTSGEVKDLSLDFNDLTSKCFSLSPDLKATSPKFESFLDSVLIAPSTPCEGMDFFGSPLDDLCEMRWTGQFDRFDVDVSVGAIEATVPLLYDSENCDDNLTSPVSSPGSPSSPVSPSEIF